MYLRGNQAFASREEALAHISETPWSNWTKADYTLEQWHAACLIHTHEGEPTSKSECKLPVKTPDGTLNRNGVHAAAAALAGARGGLKGVSAEQKTMAANALKRYYSQLDEDLPESLAEHGALNRSSLYDIPEKPGSPEDILKHHGVKGMRWGVRKKEETSDRRPAKKEETSDRRPAMKEKTSDRRSVKKEETPKETAARNEVQKQVMEAVVGKPPVDFSKTNSSSSLGDRLKESGFERDGQLSKREKQALLLAGGIGIGVGGFVAYKYMGGDIAMPKAWKVPEGLNKRPLSKSKLGELGHGHDMFELVDKQFHNLDTSKGYAIWTPKNDNMPHTVRSFADNPFGKKMHDEMVASVDEMRERYPAIRNMNLEVVPMSMVPGMEEMAKQKSGAAVMAIKAGEARIMYNDLMPDGYSAAERAHVQRMMPGLKHDGFTGYHEMGHLLAAAKGDLPPAFDMMTRSREAMEIETTRDVGKLVGFMKDGVRFNRVKHDLHKDRMKKHGLTYKELRKLSPYAATQPAEAIAELAGNYFHPETRAQMSPEMAAKAKALFDDLGGVVS